MIASSSPTRFLLLIIIVLVAPAITYAQDFWTQTPGPTGGMLNDLVSAPDGTLYTTAGYVGVYRSTDAGASWSLLTTGLPFYRDLRDIARAPNGTLLVVTADSGIYRSTDRGATWSASNTGLEKSGSAWYYYTVAAGADGTLYATTETRLYRSTFAAPRQSPHQLLPLSRTMHSSTPSPHRIRFLMKRSSTIRFAARGA